jgi:hypothetical protein
MLAAFAFARSKSATSCFRVVGHVVGLDPLIAYVDGFGLFKAKVEEISEEFSGEKR